MKSNCENMADSFSVMSQHFCFIYGALSVNISMLNTFLSIHLFLFTFDSVLNTYRVGHWFLRCNFIRILSHYMDCVWQTKIEMEESLARCTKYLQYVTLSKAASCQKRQCLGQNAEWHFACRYVLS